MGKAVELITVQATAPSTGAAFTAVSGNSLTIRDSRAPIWFLAAFSRRQSGGFIRYTSPLLHDAVVGMQFAAAIDPDVQLDHEGGWQRLYAQDTLTAFGAGSATAGDLEHSSFLVGYEDLPGVEGNFIDAADLRRRAVSIYSMPNTLALTAAGGYSGEALINAEVDQFKAQTEYALVGYEVGTIKCHAVRWRSQDWGNLGVGGPGNQDAFLTQDWFVRLSTKCGMPLIPVFNSANKSSTFIDGVQSELATDPTITTTWAELAPRSKRNG